MVYIPRGDTTPLLDPPIIQPFPGLDVLRRQTHWFIENDPTDIVLIPTGKVSAPGGGWNIATLPPRPNQRFKVIYQGGAADGILNTTDGQVRKFDFILLGEWDASMEIGDTFTEAAHGNQKWVVNGLQPYNGYEIKAGVVSYGGDPQHG